MAFRFITAGLLSVLLVQSLSANIDVSVLYQEKLGKDRFVRIELCDKLGETPADPNTYSELNHLYFLISPGEGWIFKSKDVEK